MRRALSFLTPFGPSGVPTQATLGWFPVVGALVGCAVGGAWWLAGRAWPPLVAAVVAVACDVVVTGGLHLDGLADAADGLLPPLPAERRLEAMADPAVGAFGVCTLVVVLLLRTAAFSSVPATVLVVGGVWCASRTAMALTARLGTYVRPGGLAAAFVGEDDRPGPWIGAVVGAGLALGLAAAGRGWHGLWSVAATAVVFGAVVVFARRRIGGFTGDVLGAAGVVGETAGLLVLVAKW